MIRLIDEILTAPDVMASSLDAAFDRLDIECDALAAWTRDRYVFEMSAARWAVDLAVETGQRQAGIGEASRRVALQKGLSDMPDSIRALIGA